MSEEDGQEVKPFLDHLEDFRGMIFRCILALGIGMAIALPLTPWLIEILKRPLQDVVTNPDRFLQSLEVAGALTVALRTSLWAGLLLSAPFLFFFIGQFIFPGLTPREKAMVWKSSGYAIGLFFLGVLIAYFITLKLAVGVMFKLHGWLGIEAAWRINDYIAFTVHLLIAFGVAFEMPVVLVIVARLGLVNVTQLRERRRHVAVVLLLVAMLLTPPDPFTQMAMALPLYLLYEVCIWVVHASEQRKAREEDES